MKSKRNFRKNIKKNKTRKKRGGGPEEDAELFAAVQKSETTVDQINVILDKGANVNAINSEGELVLHWTCDIGNTKVAIALVDRGADVNARDKYGDTPLHLACMNGNKEVALALVDRGADIDAKNTNNKTPLDVAEETINKEALRNAAAIYKGNNEPENINERNFITTKKQWKIYLDNPIEEFENLNGKYEVEFVDGSIYLGNWKDNKKDGKGTMTYDDGDVYEGDWKDDVKDGKGKMTYANGSVYEGDYNNGERHGKGKYTWANGDMYEGDYQDDKRNGNGKYTWANGDMYEGDFAKNKRHGKGEFKYINGNFYKGESKNGKKNGYGVMKYETAQYDGMIPAGSTYDGYWKNDKMHTRGSELGKLTWPANDADEIKYPDRSTPCGLRSFEGQWYRGYPILPEGYDDSPMSLENWGTYIWKQGDHILLNQRTAYAYEIHQKGKKIQEKLGPALDFMENDYNTVSEEKGVPKIDETYGETPEWIIAGLKSHSKEFLNHLLENEDEIRRKSTSIDLILDKLSTSDYVRNRDTKRIIAICFYYVLGELKSIEEGVEKVHFEGVKHEPDFQLYYINTFIEDNIAAYDGPNGMSCTQGIFERFFTVLESTLALAVAPGNESFLGKDEATIQERREKYERILDLWGRNKPKMEVILASFDAQEDRSMLKGIKQKKKIRILIDFIKSKYAEAGQDISTVEKDFDDYLKKMNTNRDGLFVGDPDYIFGGKRKTLRRKKTKTTTRRKGKKYSFKLRKTKKKNKNLI